VELSRRADNADLEIANLIRLATAIQYAGRHAEARAMFELALRRCERGIASAYEDFALQHLGKLLVEQGHVARGLPLLERGLLLRRRKGDAALIASIDRALAGARTLFPEGGKGVVSTPPRHTEK
jgi:hypothetical protein